MKNSVYSLITSLILLSKASECSESSKKTADSAAKTAGDLQPRTFDIIDKLCKKLGIGFGCGGAGNHYGNPGLNSYGYPGYGNGNPGFGHGTPGLFGLGNKGGLFGAGNSGLFGGGNHGLFGLGNKGGHLGAGNPGLFGLGNKGGLFGAGNHGLFGLGNQGGLHGAGNPGLFGTSNPGLFGLGNKGGLHNSGTKGEILGHNPFYGVYPGFNRYPHLHGSAPFSNPYVYGYPYAYAPLHNYGVMPFAGYAPYHDVSVNPPPIHVQQVVGVPSNVGYPVPEINHLTSSAYYRPIYAAASYTSPQIVYDKTPLAYPKPVALPPATPVYNRPLPVANLPTKTHHLPAPVVISHPQYTKPATGIKPMYHHPSDIKPIAAYDEPKQSVVQHIHVHEVAPIKEHKYNNAIHQVVVKQPEKLTGDSYDCECIAAYLCPSENIFRDDIRNVRGVMNPRGSRSGKKSDRIIFPRDKREAELEQRHFGCAGERICCRTNARFRRSLSKKTCGRLTGDLDDYVSSSSTKTFRGLDWQAAIVKERGKETESVCGGVLVESSRVLVGASCLSKLDKKRLQVRFDIDNSLTKTTDDVLNTFLVNKIEVFSLNVSGNSDGRLAILELDVDANNGTAPTPVCLPKESYSPRKCFSIHWKASSIPGHGFNLVEKSSIADISKCQGQTETRNGILCVSEPKACKHYNGGSHLVCPGEKGDFQLVGLAMPGKLCRKTFRSYMDVEHYMKLLVNTTDA